MPKKKKKKFANWQCDCPKKKRGNVTGNGVTQKKRQKDSRKREEKKKYNLKWRYLYKLYHSALFPLYFPPKLRG